VARKVHAQDDKAKAATQNTNQDQISATYQTETKFFSNRQTSVNHYSRVDGLIDALSKA
jgi:hypothetical protein